jgi:HSP20 family protein
MNKPNNFPFNWENTNNTNSILLETPFSLWNVAPFTNNPALNTVTNWVNYTPTTPSVNTYETSDSYVFEIAAPGYTKESFEVAYSNNSMYQTLTVKATENKSERPTNYSYREYNYSSFTREFNIPNNAETSETRAKYDNGILTIMIPKSVSNTNYRTVKIS